MVDKSVTDTSAYIKNIEKAYSVIPSPLEPLDSPEEFPFNAIGMLKITRSGADNNSIATGFLVGDNLVLTAAHCVEDYSGARLLDIEFCLGEHYDIIKGYSCIAKAHASAYYVSALWTEAQNSEYDWALLKLDEAMPAEDNVSHLVCKVVPNAFGKSILVSGYGGEGTEELGCVQHMSEGKVAIDDGALLTTLAGANHGHSGSPMLDLDDFSFSVIGIASAINGAERACGPKIDSTIVSLINNFNARN